MRDAANSSGIHRRSANVTMSTTPSVTAHCENAPAIIQVLWDCRTGSGRTAIRELAALPGLKDYQRLLLDRFAAVIAKPSFDYLSKTAGSWLVVGDRRREIATDIQLIIERHGLGVGMLVLHLQQLRAQHILRRVVLDGVAHDLTRPTESLAGAAGERVLWVPIREFRADFARLAALNVAKPRALWEAGGIVTHERDRNPCFYCSCEEINPGEVVVDVAASRHGLSRGYRFGFTFAPFGNPLTTTHFLAWDNSAKPLNMSRTPVTVSDLVKLTREINVTIQEYFAREAVREVPVLDGLFNGWAGNTIYHQHFQFFQPEHIAPIESPGHVARTLLSQRDDVAVERLGWPVPIFRVSAEDALNTGLVGNDLAGLWRYLGGTRRVAYRQFGAGYGVTESDKVAAHTHNLYVPGRELGRSLYLVLRDRERVDFRPGPEAWINEAANRCAQRKDNLGVLEATGTLIVDNRATFDTMRDWTEAEVSGQFRTMTAAVAPDATVVTAFEEGVRELFPE